MGPLLILAALLTACSTTPQITVDHDLGDDTIPSGDNTTLSVTVTNNDDEPVTGRITVTTDNASPITTHHPEPRLLTTTLHPGERIRRVFTVTANTTTRRTDYEITTTYDNATTPYDTATTVLTVTNG